MLRAYLEPRLITLTFPGKTRQHVLVTESTGKKCCWQGEPRGATKGSSDKLKINTYVCLYTADNQRRN